jgi:hypothetical protein
MGPYDDISICLHADWNHCQVASTRFAALHDVHWHQPPGAPHAMVHGYVACADIVAGDIPHDCDPMTAPHRLRVCVLKRHTIPKVYAELARLADTQKAFPFGHRPAGVRDVTRATARRL